MNLKLQIDGFKDVSNPKSIDTNCSQLLKRQTLFTNRAICVLSLNKCPKDLGKYLKKIRKKIAFKIGFLPLIYGMGLQVIISCPDILKMGLNPKSYVSKIDNQWCIIQSVYFVDPQARQFIESKTWGQLITSKYQDAISDQLARKLKRM